MLFPLQRDFPPIDVRAVYRPPAKIQATERRSVPKFHSVTTHSHFFKHHPVAPRVKHGDFHEGHQYVPPKDKFTAVSTTHDTFQGQMAPVPPPFKPMERPVETSGELDFRTVHRTTYNCPTMAHQLPKYQRKVLLNHLRQRKQEQMNGRVQAANHALMVANWADGLPLKIESYHYAIFVVTGGTVGCHNQSCHNAKFVITGGTSGCHNESSHNDIIDDNGTPQFVTMKTFRVPPLTKKLALWQLSVFNGCQLKKWEHATVIHQCSRLL